MTSELGPIDTLASTDGFDYETTLGTLTLVSVGPRGTFTAALGAVAVPEPASAVTVGIALLVGPAALVLRRRRSA
ncbi:MAG: PEP-CTERM sorting domain-containing protein [Isosphaeraceae bacterium]|nr:PEP-CTERM sorting domain-containing protein [Isosphaeraceae bacterium]